MNETPSTAQPSASLIPPETYETCGKCAHGIFMPADVNQVECHGGPPTPVLIGGGQDALGRVQLNIQTMWPAVLKSSRCCAVFKPKITISLD